MPIFAKDSGGGDFIPAPEGQYQAVCVDIIDLGLREVEWKGEKSMRHQIRAVFQLDKEMPDSGKPYTVSAWFTLSLHEKAKLRAFIEQIYGKRFTQEVPQKGFDVEKLLGVNGNLNILWNDKQKPYIASVMPRLANQPLLEAKEYTRVKDRPARDAQTSQAQTATAGGPVIGIASDDIPF